VEGQKVPVPFNLRSLRLLFPPQAARRLAELLQAHYGPGAAVPILKMRESPRPQIRRLAEWVYEKIYYGYTLKQWGLSPERLDPSVLARVPVRVSEDDRYFLDAYQGVPEHGYTEMFRRLLSHPNITVALNTEFLAVAGRVRFQRLIYTGAIDRFFGYARGELPYRSLRFSFAHHDREFVQETAQVNYPNDHAHTRVTEYKHITGQRLPGSTVALEYPEQHAPGRNEPYYPIPQPASRFRYEQYLKEAGKLNGTVRFAGRLGDYRYYNMDQAVARALHVFERLCVSEAAPRRRREWFFLERYDQPSPQERLPCSSPSS
jgi:UDP-galactopyranose mutase